MPIDKDSPWSDYPPAVRDAVLREMRTQLSQHLVAMTAAYNVVRASDSDGEAPAVDVVAQHSAQMVGGYHAAIVALEELAESE